MPPQGSGTAARRFGTTAMRSTPIRRTGSPGSTSRRWRVEPSDPPHTGEYTNSTPSNRGCRASNASNAGLVLALLAPPQDEPACDECAADGDDSEERKTGVRKRIVLGSSGGGIAARGCRDLHALHLVVVLIRCRRGRATARTQPLPAPGTVRRPVRCMQPRKQTRTYDFYPFLLPPASQDTEAGGDVHTSPRSREHPDLESNPTV